MKEEVILRILAQESPKSELRLQRYGEKNFRDLFVISRKWLGVFLEIFLNSRGPRCKDWAAWPGSTVDQGGVDKRVRWRLAGPRAHRCSPATVEEDEPVRRCQRGAHRSTSGAKRRRVGGKEWWWLELIMGVKEGAKELEREGKRGGEGQGLS
jgi:hypothetical protein